MTFETRNSSIESFFFAIFVFQNDEYFDAENFHPVVNGVLLLFVYGILVRHSFVIVYYLKFAIKLLIERDKTSTVQMVKI